MKVTILESFKGDRWTADERNQLSLFIPGNLWYDHKHPRFIILDGEVGVGMIHKLLPNKRFTLRLEDGSETAKLPFRIFSS